MFRRRRNDFKSSGSAGHRNSYLLSHHFYLNILFLRHALPAEMVNTTGCGDAFMAAITRAYLQGTDLEGTAKAGLAGSAIAMEGAETINPALNACAVRARAGL